MCFENWVHFLPHTTLERGLIFMKFVVFLNFAKLSLPKTNKLLKSLLLNHTQLLFVTKFSNDIHPFHVGVVELFMVYGHKKDFNYVHESSCCGAGTAKTLKLFATKINATRTFFIILLEQSLESN